MLSQRVVFMLCAIFNTWLQIFVTASFNFILIYTVQGRYNSNLVSKGNVVFFFYHPFCESISLSLFNTLFVVFCELIQHLL